MAKPDDRTLRVKRNNWIMLAILATFVVAVFSYSFLHIGREARPEGAGTATSARP
ncbi:MULTISPECIES: hypothetical protein [Agrobacterium]|uniref:hypothetical protein n=1 Tax=Agrobacterium TaxID=357 RepID=UPI0015742F0D|nr:MULTISPECIES: hypothetical protein [Agrobacterium]NTJ44154.1 hypothetical protein [Agrobacterium larrymoorei]WCK22393.1 hypothetical protein G6M09_025610 [Agrobacterium tumefaciens]